MKTKEFKGIISQSAAKDNSLILSTIEYSCIPFNPWFETHSRLKKHKKLEISQLLGLISNFFTTYALCLFIGLFDINKRVDSRSTEFNGPHFVIRVDY